MIDRIIDLESSESGADIRIKLDAFKNTTDRIRSGLVELKMMKVDTKEELEEIRPDSIILKEKKRMARFKIQTKVIMELKELESELKPKIKLNNFNV